MFLLELYPLLNILMLFFLDVYDFFSFQSLNDSSLAPSAGCSPAGVIIGPVTIGLRRCRSLQNLSAEVRTIVLGECRGRTVAAELHGLAQGVEKHFAIRTIAEVGANFLTDVTGKLVIQIGRQPFEHFDAISFSVTLVEGGLTGAWICAYAISHGGASS